MVERAARRCKGVLRACEVRACVRRTGWERGVRATALAALAAVCW